jgi:hypothetical protein
MPLLAERPSWDGKVSRTVARRYNKQKRLGASSFSSKGGGDVSSASKFFTSLAVRLTFNVPSFRQYICEVVTKRSDITSLSFTEQWRQLVLSLLSSLQRELYQFYILVVDALDECENDNNVRIILQLLAEARSLTTIRLRVFFTSRPKIPIRYSIQNILQAEHQDFVLHNHYLIATSVDDKTVKTVLGKLSDRCRVSRLRRVAYLVAINLPRKPHFFKPTLLNKEQKPCGSIVFS